jgi:2-oxoglutarate ferredoxin oxidoreductase subunit delta
VENQEIGTVVQLNRESCKGCYLCIEACPNLLFEIDTQPNQRGDFPVLLENPEYCLNCMRCVDICPDRALLPPLLPKTSFQSLVYWGSLHWHRYNLNKRQRAQR